MNQFNLENVLKYRRYLEERILSKLKLEEHKLFNENKRYGNLIKEKEEIRGCVLQKLNNGISSRDCNLYSNYEQLIGEKIDETKITIASIEKNIQNIKDELLNNKKNKKIIEKLKEKHIQNEIYKEKVIEMKNLDEFSSNQFARKMEH